MRTADAFRPLDSSLVRGAMFEVRPADTAPVPLPPGGRLSRSADAHGDVYLAGKDLRALDPDTGEERWRVPLRTEEVGSPAPSEDGTVWVSGEAVVDAFDAATGEPRGTWATGARFPLDPVPLEGGRAVVGNWQTRAVAALEPGRPEPLWVAPVGYTSQPVATAPGRVYVNLFAPGGGGAVQALDAATGAPLWLYDAGGALSCPPTAGPDGRVYVAEGGGTLAALDPATGEPLWTREAGGGLQASPTLSPDGRRVYLGSRGEKVLAFDARTGEPAWALDTRGPVRLPVAVGADGLLCVADDSGQALLVDPESGLAWAAAELGAAPRSILPLEDGAFLVETVLSRSVRVALPRDGPPEPAGTIEEVASGVRIGEIHLPRRA